MEKLLVTLLIILVVIFFIRSFKKLSKSKWIKPTKPFPISWRTILSENIAFYNNLNQEDKQRFEFKVHEFIN